MLMDDKKKEAFNKILFHWHKTHYRDMPWRPKTRDARVRLNPYRILVSEVMLQQTQVSRVLTKYAQFLKKFPNVDVLAEASLGDVLRVWSGLGYNRRARYLHECAKKIVNEYDGKFPDDLEELKKLPGIGLSTAGALLAFSFGKDEPMIDTNIRRILTRTFFKKVIPRDSELYLFAKSLIPKGSGRAWNYAMLDLGAMLCTARNHSLECPIANFHGRVGNFQHKEPQKKFFESDRFYRGQILKLLMGSGSITSGKIQKHLNTGRERTRRLIGALEREHLLAKLRGKISLPS